MSADLSAILAGLTKAGIDFILDGDLLEHSVEIEFRGHTLRVLDLKMLIQLKRTSTDPKDRRRLPVLEETLRQLEQEYGSDQDNYKKNDED